MNRWIVIASALAACGAAVAKLPPPDDAAKAKAAEAAAKTAWQAKVDAYKLCKVQDAVAARYKGNHPAEAKIEPVKATPAEATASSSGKPPPAANDASKKDASTKAVAASGPASSTGGPATPSAAVAAAQPVPACTDPGPFAYAPPGQKPLETSEAHSPAATATSPPSVRAESGAMTSGKK
jgi:hypothetical protein